LGNLVPQLAIRFEIDGQQVIAVDVLELPVGKPDEVLIGDGSVGQRRAHRHHAIENMELIRDPGLPAGHVHNPFGIDAREGHALEPLVDVLVVVARILDSEYGQQLRRREAYGIGYFAHAIAHVLEEFVEREVLVEVGGGRQAVFRGREDGRLSLDGFAVQLAAEENDLLAGLRAAVLRWGEESQGIEVLFDLDEVFGGFGLDRRLGGRNSEGPLGVRTEFRITERR
jgi:hypothetical protein